MYCAKHGKEKNCLGKLIRTTKKNNENKFERDRKVPSVEKTFLRLPLKLVYCNPWPSVSRSEALFLMQIFILNESPLKNIAKYRF